MGRPIKACLEINAENYGFDLAGNFQPEADTNVPSWCTYENPMDQDEETLAEEIGSEDYTTHEEAQERTANNKKTDWAINRNNMSKERMDGMQNTAMIGLGLLAIMGGFI